MASEESSTCLESVVLGAGFLGGGLESSSESSSVSRFCLAEELLVFEVEDAMG